MKKDEEHIRMRNKVEDLIDGDLSDEEIAGRLSLEVGTRYKPKSVRWYKYCLIAQKNQRKAFEKYGMKLYSRAGKTAQKRHPWIGYELGKKYGPENARKRIEQVRASGKAKEYYSMLAKKLQEKDPEHSRRNMKKAIAKMKREGTFIKNSLKGTKRCMELYPNHFSKMGKRAHQLYPNLAYTSRLIRRQGSPYLFMGCNFDSNQEREVCKMLVREEFFDKPIEGENVHFKINACDIDFFIQQKLFLEFHPILNYGRYKGETEEEYYLRRREILDKNGYKNFPLVVISSFKKAQDKVAEIKLLLED